MAVFTSLFLISLVCLSIPQPLAKRVFTLYSLEVWLLPKQHRDNVGLHDLTCWLGYAGRKLCSSLSAPDEEVSL